MASIEKTVFISYRRTDVYNALAVYENLKNHGYDVFFDYRSIASGDFEQIIISNIRARAHFLVILTPTALDRCNEPGDWLRREIETAIDEKRNIVPLFFKRFQFGASSGSGIFRWFPRGKSSFSNSLTGKLKDLSRYNGLNVHEDYFDEAMHRLRTQYLNLPLNTVLHPVSTEVRKVVIEEQLAADEALEQIEDVQELAKGSEGKLTAPKRQLDSKPVEIPKEEHKDESGAKSFLRRYIPERAKLNTGLMGGIAGGIIVLGLCLWGGASLLNNLPSFAPEPTRTNQPAILRTATSIQPFVPSTETSIPSTPQLGIGSTIISEKDGMTLLFVPAGEFTVGSDDGSSDERPVHKVTLDAFWIDQTEVTNEMFAKCVQDGSCNPPSNTTNYDDSDHADHPVVFISWTDANAYCSWADRRLPTEAEWEKAARGENALIYPWGNNAPNSNLLNYNNNVGDTTEVGNYPDGASPYGALDMAGNVWEWVADWYGKSYYASSLASNPLGPDSGQYRVLRGGSWSYSDYNVRSAYRNWYVPTASNYNLGFRCSSSP